MTTGKPRVLVPKKYKNDIADHLPEYERMSTIVEFVPFELTNSDDLKAFLPTSKVDALWITEELFLYSEPPMRYLDYFPDTLKLILVPWVGTDFLDGAVLKERGISICNVGPAAADNVSDLAAFLVLSCFRLTSFWEHCFRFMHRGSVAKCREYIGGTHHDTVPGFALVDHGHEMNQTLSGEQKFPAKLGDGQCVNMAKDFTIAGKLLESPTNKNALVLGFGSIGQAIGKRLSAGFGMHVSYTKRSGPVDGKVLGYEAKYYESIEDEEMWGEADVIVMALPGLKETEDLLNKETLSKCKNGVRIVNVGRGSCINEDDLLEALDTGKVTSAGLDVFKNEHTMVDPRFFERWDVTLLPHIGSAVVDILQRHTLATLENIEHFFFKDGKPKYPCN